MTGLLVLKEHIKNFYSKNEYYVLPFFKFLMAFIAFLVINGRLGYMTQLNSIAVVLVLALMCSFLPINFIIIVSAGMVLMHLYKLSMESAIVTAVLFLVLFLLYFRFSPKDTMVVLLTPICFFLKIPYVIPITMGLIGAPTSIISVTSGVIVYYLLAHISGGTSTLTATDAEEATQKFRFVIDGVLNNKGMFVTIAAFAITLLAVYMIRRMSMDHAWSIAIAVGGIADIVILLAGDLIFDTKISILGTIIGTIFSILLSFVVQFFFFNVDYTRTENVQFEDDEYYYYVKAVPKIAVSTPEKKVKKINPQRPARVERNVEQHINTNRRSAAPRENREYPHRNRENDLK